AGGHDRGKSRRYDHGPPCFARRKSRPPKRSGIMSNNAEQSRTLKVQAMVCHAAGEPLVLETLDLAAPVDDEILVEIMASGLCHTDASQISGASAPFPFPVVAGHEGAGIVREVGPAVTEIKVGDHVV